MYGYAHFLFLQMPHWCVLKESNWAHKNKKKKNAIPGGCAAHYSPEARRMGRWSPEAADIHICNKHLTSV